MDYNIMILHLVDINFEMVEQWKIYFTDFPDVKIECGDILELAENTIVSPANSHGFMDGGIDEIYSRFFGATPEKNIQRAIRLRPEGCLPVGAAVLVNTGHSRIPYMISAPTMETPGSVPPAHCFFAMAAILKVAHKYKDKVSRLFCPGLATGTGRVAPELAAKEMAAAYGKYLRTVS